MLIYSKSIIEKTINYLQQGGATGIETVVLWLGAVKENGQLTVSAVHRPDQQAAADQFYIAPGAMRSLMTHLRETRTRILAQVHSHPYEAFHSPADDKWAIIRHAGAISLVVPDFAQHTTIDNFPIQVAAYQLSPANQWQKVDFNSIAEVL